MGRAEQLITENLGLWASAVKAKASAGRGSNKKQEHYGITKLRELILELAIHGLLAKACQSDKPIRNTIDDINAERLRLEKEGTIRSKKPLPSIRANEKLFELPEHWEWLRLREIGHDWGQVKPETDFTYIDVSAINKERGTISDPQVLPAKDAPSRARKIIKEGTVIYSTVRPYLLNIAVVYKCPEPPPIASTAFAIIHPLKGVLARYIYYYLRSPTFTKYVESCQTGTSYPAINDKQFFSGVIPIPPFQEQKRIIAKVDELMALCDQLEEEQENNLENHETLVSTLLNALTSASTNASQFADAWQRIQANFDILFTTEGSIDQLKETILQLAVMGKLVPQELDEKSIDESISCPQDFLQTDYNLPTNWREAKYSHLTSLITSGSRGWKQYFSKKGATFIRTQNIKTDELLLDDVVFVDLPAKTEGKRTKVLDGDILITITGANVTKCALITAAPAEAYVSQHIALTRPIWTELSPWLLLCFHSKGSARGELEALAYGDKPGLNLTQINNVSIPLPPLTEQHRIIDKVNELMTLCDQLKASFAASQATQLNIVDSIVEQAIHSPT